MGLSVSSLVRGVIAKLAPQAQSDSAQSDYPIRLKRYGEVNISETASNLYGYAEEGSFLVACTPTAGTGGTGVTAQIVINLTGPAILIQNNEPASGKSLNMAWVKMIATAAATSTTSQYYACHLDNTLRTPTTNNYLSLTANSSNGMTAAIAQPTVLLQNSATVSVIPAASSAVRIVGRGCLGGLNIIGDEMIINFGSHEISPHAGLTAAQAAAPSKRVSNAPPVSIGPGQSLAIHLWGLAQSAAYSPEVEIAMWAR